MFNSDLVVLDMRNQCFKHGLSVYLVLDMVDILMETPYTSDYITCLSYFWV
jgi:hypothetical protein